MRKKKSELDTSKRKDSAVLIELRHEAGLTAGNTMMLQLGRYQFGPTVGEAGGLSAGNPSVVGFELNILAADEIAIIPHATTIKVDGKVITQPERVFPGQSIQVGADHFVLGKSDEFLSLAQRQRDEIVVGRVPKLDEKRGSSAWLLWLVVLAIGLVATALHSRWWILLVAVAAVGALATWILRRRRSKREHQRHSTAVVGASSALSEDLAAVRSLVARQCRAAHLSPTDIVTQSLRPENGDTAVVSSGQQLEVSLGLGDVAWTPTVSPREHAGWDYQPVVEQYASLSAVPFLLDLHAGPIAIVGEPLATAAIARHLEQSALNLAGQKLRLVTATSGNDVRPAETASDSLPVIYLLERDHPVGCSTVVEIAADGFASVFDEQGNETALDVVPNGLPANEARSGLPANEAKTGLPANEAQSGLPANEAQSGPHSTDIDLTGAAISVNGDESRDSFLGATSVPITFTEPTPSFESVRLYTSDSHMVSKESLARTGLELAERSTPDELSITILDSGDRGLIRLKQLEHCVGYATIDDDAGSVEVINTLVSALNAPQGQVQVILASEFPDLLSFLNRSGRKSMADRLADLAEQTSDDQLLIVASATSEDASDSATIGPNPDISSAVAQLLETAAL